MAIFIRHICDERKKYSWTSLITKAIRYKICIGSFGFVSCLHFYAVTGTVTDTGSKSPLSNLPNLYETYQKLLAKQIGELLYNIQYSKYSLLLLLPDLRTVILYQYIVTTGHTVFILIRKASCIF